jgi:hypothetical protein
VEPETTSTTEQRFGKLNLATTDRMTTNCSKWLSLFGSAEVIKGRTSENAQVESSFVIRHSGREDSGGPV